MNIYFSGIGGVGLGALAELAQDAGHTVQGSDTHESLTTKELTARGIAVNLKQTGAFLQATHHTAPIDLFVYTAALPPDHVELQMARNLGIKTVKRDELISTIIADKNLKLIAVSGTHGKTTTTAMLVWAFQQLGIPVSYCVGTSISFGASGHYAPNSQYFIYECDEFDRNFLAFHPFLSIITSIDYDHPDTYGTPKDYLAAFNQFIEQSETTVMWSSDGAMVGADNNTTILLPEDAVASIRLPGEYYRRDATLALKALEKVGSAGDLIEALSGYPGSTRRFERLAPNLYSDYGHHPTEIAATLQMARELNEHVTLVYQPHQNTRQHQVRSQYADCFELASDIYWLPTYLTREDPSLAILTPEQLTEDITNQSSVHIVGAKDDLWGIIQHARANGSMVLVMGAGSIDAWLRDKINTPQVVNILLVDTEGNFILRRNSQSTDNLVSTLSGNVTHDDISLLAAARRIIRDSTNIDLNANQLIYFRTYARSIQSHGEKVLITYFIMPKIAANAVQLRNGLTPVTISPNSLSQFNIPILDRSAIAEFTHPAG